MSSASSELFLHHLVTNKTSVLVETHKWMHLLCHFPQDHLLYFHQVYYCAVT